MSLKSAIYRLLSLTPAARPEPAAKNTPHEPLVQLLDRVHAEAIMPNAEAIAQIFVERDVALVFYENTTAPRGDLALLFLLVGQPR